MDLDDLFTALSGDASLDHLREAMTTPDLDMEAAALSLSEQSSEDLSSLCSIVIFSADNNDEVNGALAFRVLMSSWDEARVKMALARACQVVAACYIRDRDGEEMEDE